jgi:methylmalonyl-CoA mutase N-terminal domain/subunit
VTIQALAAVLGGTQSLHTNAFDEALGLPSEETARLALRTQQVIAHESGVTETVDPVGGSYAIEALTNAIALRVQQYLDKIAALGGMLRAIETSYIQEEIQQSAYQYQKAVEEKRTIVVGVNEFRTTEETNVPVVSIDPTVEKHQKEKLIQLRKERNNEKVQAILTHLEHAAQGKKNLFPIILEAVEAYATLGEISDTLRKVFGEYQEKVVL